MARKNTTKTEEAIYSAKALMYLKYEGERIAPGTEFKVKESDIKELKSKGCAEIEEIADVKETQVPGEEPPVNTDGKEGENPPINIDGEKGGKDGE